MVYLVGVRCTVMSNPIRIKGRTHPPMTNGCVRERDKNTEYQRSVI